MTNVQLFVESLRMKGWGEEEGGRGRGGGRACEHSFLSSSLWSKH